MIETLLTQLNLVVSESVVQNMRATTQDMLNFICKEFLPKLPEIFFQNIGQGISRDQLAYGEDAFLVSRQKHQRHSALFLQLVLSGFYIAEAITQDKQLNFKKDTLTKGIQTCLPKVVAEVNEIMAANREGANQFFTKYLQILQAAIDLLDRDSIDELMSGKNNQPMRLVLQRLQDGGSNIEEVIRMVQLLDTYASTPFGARDMINESIFHVLLKNTYVQKIPAHGYYQDGQGTEGVGKAER